MSETYVLRRHGSDAPLRIRAKPGQSAREVYEAAVSARELDPATISSFYRAGRMIPLQGEFGGAARDGHHIPGEELVFEMRGLPALGDDAAMVHQGWFNDGRGAIIDPQALRLSDRAAAAFQELEEAGLAVIETLTDGRYRHQLTYEGLSRPEVRLPAAKYGIPFRIAERLEQASEIALEVAGPDGP
ncbi:hypothetical protein [Paracoccus sp. ME4]|uniref:hypothetical protein n=1 Tax=Paracoccus sp. ME4 TaxID=3138066 RepID=UPI00398B0D68